MKKTIFILATLIAAPALAASPNQGSPTFGSVTLQTPLPLSSGGVGSVTAAGGRLNLGAAASGANSDITSLSGLTTAVPLIEGGTGAATASGALANLGAAPYSLKKTGAAQSEAILQTLQDYDYSVREFGASGSSSATTGSIAASGTTLTLASAVDFQNGQGISIAGAGPSGGVLIDKIASGAGTTSLTLSVAASTTVSSTAVIHDDTTAIQATINYVMSAGGGVVFFPNGTYNIGGPFVTDGTTTGQIEIPYIPTTSPMETLILRGQSTNGNYVENMGYPLPVNGVILNATPQSNVATDSVVWASCPGCTTGQYTYSQVNLSLNNITVRTPTTAAGPALTGLNFTWANLLNLENVSVDTTALMNAIPNPTDGASGIDLPASANAGYVYAKNVFVVGYNVGIVAWAHAVLDDVYLQQDFYGVKVESGGHAAWFIRVLIQDCTNLLEFVSGTASGYIDVERVPTSAGWYGTTTAAAGSGGVGSISYWDEPTSGAPAFLTLGNANPGVKFTNISGSRGSAAAITVTASPFAYTFPQSGQVCVSGGTVSGETLTRNGTVVPTGETSGCVTGGTGDVLTVAYSAAPTVNYVP